MELPLWLIDPAFAGMLSVDPAAAFAAGLEPRPLEETVRDTLAWAQAEGAGLVTETPYGTAGLDPAREAELLEAWRSQSRAGV
jgi:2'-hydroxyisoflavone reductase